MESYRICLFVSWAYFICHNFLKVHPCCSMYQHVSFFKTEWYSVVWICHFLFIYSSINRHLVCIHILTCIHNIFVVNDAPIHMSLQIPSQVLGFSSFRYLEFLNHIVTLFLIFWEAIILFSMPYYFTFPSVVHKDSSFSTSLPTHTTFFK